MRRLQGFTLLEVMLALAISALVLALVGSGIRLQMRMVDSRQNGVEHIELARAILRQITQELQSIVPPTAADSRAGGSATGATADGGAGTGGTGTGGTGTGGAGTGGTGTGGTGGTATGESSGDGSSTDDSGTDTATGQTIDSSLQTAVGLYGDSVSLRFETAIARPLSPITIPNSTGTAAATTVPSQSQSELRTVAYFLGASPQGVSSSLMDGRTAAGSNTATDASLMRSELDYQAHTFLLENGGQTQTQASLVPFAVEVRGLRFQYFDGVQWLDQWDSVAQGGLPHAVQCTIVLSPLSNNSAARLETGSPSSTTELSDATYSTIVRLPVVPMNYDNQQE